MQVQGRCKSPEPAHIEGRASTNEGAIRDGDRKRWQVSVQTEGDRTYLDISDELSPLEINQ